jgi:uncharacterized protein (UPF0335 family)
MTSVLLGVSSLHLPGGRPSRRRALSPRTQREGETMAIAFAHPPFPPSPPAEAEPALLPSHVRAREGVGHNGIAADVLKSYIERVERLHEERQAIAADISDIYGEAKGNGFDTKIIRKIVAMRRLDADDRAEQETILELYLEALGMR